MENKKVAGTDYKTTIANIFKHIEHRRYYIIIFYAILVSLLFTVIASPGFMFTDSYGRIYKAERIVLGDFSAVGNWHSIVPSVVMAIFLKLFGNIAAYSFAVCFMYIFTTFLVFDTLTTKYSLPLTVIFFLFPIFQGFSVFYDMATGCAVGINLAFYFICNANKKRKTFMLYILMLACSLALIWGYRQNALTILPVLVLFSFILYKNRKSIMISQLIAIVLSVVMSTAITNFPGFTHDFKVQGVGFLWDTISMLEYLQDKEEYAGYMDFIAGEGTTELAIKTNSDINIFGYSAHIPYDKAGVKDISEQIQKKYIQLIIKEPWTFVKVKAKMTLNLLGVTKPLVNDAFFYDRSGDMKNYNFKDTQLRRDFFENYHKTLNDNTIIRIPIAVLAITLMLMLAFYLKNKKNADNKEKMRKLMFLLLMAIFYYGAFVLNAQYFEFRYFFPSFHLLVIISMYIVTELISGIANKRYKLLTGVTLVAAITAMMLRPCDYYISAVDLSDENWTNGVLNNQSVVLLYYNNANILALNRAKQIKVGDIIADVEDVTQNVKYKDNLYIQVKIKTSDAEKLEYPAKMEVIK